MAQIALKAKKLPLSKLKKMFKEHFGINDTGLSKDQIATKLASAGQKSVKQSKNVVAAKNFLKGTGLTALGLSPFIIDDKAIKNYKKNVPLFFDQDYINDIEYSKVVSHYSHPHINNILPEFYKKS